MAKQKELEVEGRADVAWSGTRDEKWKNSASELVVMGQGSSEGASAWSTRGTYWMGTNREDGNLEYFYELKQQATAKGSNIM